MAAANQNKYLSKLSTSRVLVFGGTSGIGFCVAEACVEHGAQVIISGSKDEKLENALRRLKASYSTYSDRITGHVCDLSDPAVLEANLKGLFETIGSPINHIAFTAGDAFKVIPVSSADVATIQRLSVVRFLAPLIIAKLAPTYLISSPDSSLTLTSGSNSDKPTPGWTILAAYGSAIEGMMRGLAVDLAPVRVNVVSPGAVKTELFDEFAGERLEGILKGFREGTLTGRVGRPEDLAEAYLWCMKDGCVTGNVVHDDGGRLVK